MHIANAIITPMMGKSPQQIRIDGLKVKFFTSIGIAVFSALISIATIIFAAQESPLTPELSHRVAGTVMLFVALTVLMIFRAIDAWQIASTLDSVRTQTLSSPQGKSRSPERHASPEAPRRLAPDSLQKKD